ncbi:MAG: serine hydrolase [Pyrinomonadaceae bacterium]
MRPTAFEAVTFTKPPPLAGVSDWVKAFLATPIVHQPGTKFLYNSLATYMLSAIVQKVTGQKIIDYLTPRLFVPLGIQGMDWEVDPQGINTGGWGLRIKTEDMAKFGQLYLQKGSWEGKQILPKEWIEEATTAKIEQGPVWVSPQTKKDSSDWLQGYCYQFWRCRYNAFRADGAFGQFIIVMPDQDAVIVLTAETPDMQDEINLIWKFLLPAIHKDKLPANENMAATLKGKLSSLALPLPAKSAASSVATRISGKTFAIEPNEQRIEAVSFQFKDETCHVALKTDAVVDNLAFGSGTWRIGETNKRGPYLLARAKTNSVGLPPHKVVGSYRWRDENTLELTLRYVESPHTETTICRFDENNITVDIQNSIETDPKSKKPVLKGAWSE